MRTLVLDASSSKEVGLSRKHINPSFFFPPSFPISCSFSCTRINSSLYLKFYEHTNNMHTLNTVVHTVINIISPNLVSENNVNLFASARHKT